MSRTLRLAHYMVRTAGLEEKVELLNKKYPLLPKFPDIDCRKLINKFSVFDPTPNKKYLEWIIRQAYKRSFRWTWYGTNSDRLELFFEDGTRVRVALENFEKMKNKGILKNNNINVDIGKYTLHDLEGVIDRFKDELIEEPKVQGGKEIYNDGKVQIIQIGPLKNDIDSEQEDEMTVKAACAYAEGVHWCTKGREVAEYYLNQGPLYIIRLNNKRLAQFHPASNQLMDVKDRPLNLTAYPDVEKALQKMKIHTL